MRTTDSDPAVSPAGKSPVVTWFRTHSAPRFVIVGGIAVFIDVGLLRLLHGDLGVQLLTATGIAYIASGVPSFLLNRYWSFQSGVDGIAHRQFARFFISMALNLLSTLLIVGLLSWLGVYYLIAKLVAIVLNAIANFFAYRHWVFT